RIGRVDAVAVLEAQHRRLRERAIIDGEGRPRLWQRLERDIGGARLRVVKHVVALAEGAALAILPREADGRAVGQNRGKGERLGEAPVDSAGLLDTLAPPLQ